MRDYKKIKAWQLADDLVMLLYPATVDFPAEEKFTLVSQIRRAGVSIAANICEGSSRRTKRDYLNFLYIARGSLMETEYLVSIAKRMGYFKDSFCNEINSLLPELQSKLYGLIRSVEKEVDGQ